MEANIEESLVSFIKDRLKGHPMYEIIDNIMTVNNESSEPEDPESWALTIHRIQNILAGMKPMTNEYAESWLALGELRNLARMVVNHDPKTEEPDELFYREHPEAIPVDFESFIGIVVQSINDYANSEVPKHRVN